MVKYDISLNRAPYNTNVSQLVDLRADQSNLPQQKAVTLTIPDLPLPLHKKRGEKEKVLSTMKHTVLPFHFFSIYVSYLVTI